MTDISPTSFAEMKAELTHVRATLDELARDVRPVLLARSGDLAAVASLQRDISASHEKHRETTRRLAEVDERIDAVQLTPAQRTSIASFVNNVGVPQFNSENDL